MNTLHVPSRRYASSCRTGFQSHRHWLTDLTDQLVGTFITTDDWLLRIVGLGVQVQDIFPAPHELGADRGETPCLLQPRLEDGFFSVWRTVSSEIDSTCCSSTSLSARSGIVQHCRSSGGILQASATRNAACLPTSLRCPLERGRPFKAASSPSSTERLRVRTTVAVLLCNAWAMASSVA
jgi:hypothetical protein